MRRRGRRAVPVDRSARRPSPSSRSRGPFLSARGERPAASEYRLIGVRKPRRRMAVTSRCPGWPARRGKADTSSALRGKICSDTPTPCHGRSRPRHRLTATADHGASGDRARRSEVLDPPDRDRGDLDRLIQESNPTPSRSSVRSQRLRLPPLSSAATMERRVSSTPDSAQAPGGRGWAWSAPSPAPSVRSACRTGGRASRSRRIGPRPRRDR